MSRKMKRFFEKPLRRSENNDIDEIDVSKYLIEGIKIDNNDMSMVNTYIKNPKFGSFVLKSYANNYTEDEREVDINISNGRRTITFEFNRDFDEFLMAIIDYCDENGLTFKDGTERNINTTWIAVYR